MSAACPAAIDHAPPISTLQIGLEWFPDGIGGGASRVFSALTDCFAHQGVIVHGIALGRRPIAARRDGIRVFCAYDAPLIERMRRARATVRDIVTTQRVDVVGSHFALFTSACLDVIKHLPLVVHFHGPWAAESQAEGGSPIATSMQFLIERIVYSRAQKAIVLTRAFGDILHRRYGVPLEKIRIIPGGVDVDRFNLRISRDEERSRLRLPMDRPVIVAVRRLTRRMGFENLIASFAEVHKAYPDALLVIVGTGPLSNLLKQQVRAYALDDSVLFTGRVPDNDLPSYYRAADFSIVPSVALEGFGLVVAESLACGTPAIVTPVGGLPEAVCDLSEHLVLEDSGIGAITQGLKSALAGTLQLPAPAACAAYAREHFSWSIIAKQVKSVYHEIL